MRATVRGMARGGVAGGFDDGDDESRTLVRASTVVGLAVATVLGVGLLMLHLHWTNPWIAIPVLTVLALGWIGLASRPSWFVALALGAVGVLAGVAVVALSPPTGEEMAAAAAPLVDEVEWSWQGSDQTIPWLAPVVNLSATSDAASPHDAVAAIADRASEHGFEVRVLRPEGGAGDLADEGPTVWDLVATRDGATVRIATSTGAGGPFVHGIVTWAAPVIGTWPYESAGQGSIAGVAADAAAIFTGGLLIGLGSLLGVASVVAGWGALRRAVLDGRRRRPTVVP